MRNLIKSHKLGLILTLIGVVGMTILIATPARANHAGCANFYNRCVSHGYFTGQPYNVGSGQGTYVMSTGQPNNWNSRQGMPVYNVNEFIGLIRARLDDRDPGSIDRYQDSTGAAFIINTMMGRWGTDFGSRDAGVVHARNIFAEWEKRVRWYDSQGLIEWDRKYAYPVGFENSLYARDIRDEVYINHPEYQAEWTIMIHAPGHGPSSGDPRREFQIKKNCGNPIGATRGLQPVPQPRTVIQGIKVPNNESAINNAPITYVEGGGPVPNGTVTNANPYSFSVYHAEHRINANTTPPGWRLIGYTLCINNTGCHGNPPTPSNTAYVDLRGGGYADLWWHYERLQPPQPTITNLQCVNGVVTARINWNTGALPPTRYMVDIDDASNFNQFWNKSVPQGNSSTDAPAGFNPYPSGGAALVLRRGQQYHVRVYYVNSNQHSQVARFTAPTCWRFEVTSLRASVDLKPTDEAPENADFRSGFNIVYNPSGSPLPQGVRLTVTRSYYVQRANGSRTNISSPNPDSRWFNGSSTHSHDYPVDNRSLPAVNIGDQVCITISVTPSFGSVDNNGNVSPPTGAAISLPPQCERVMAKPYFKVYGGDVSAGSTGACRGWSASSEKSGIVAFAYNNPTNAGRGSGTQLAAFALGEINEFSSANGRTASPTPIKGLTFANDASGPAWGGNLAEGLCAYDYYNTRPATVEHNGNLDLGSVALGQTNYFVSTESDINIRGTLGAGRQVAVYVNGNVLIDQNIAYAAAGSGWGMDQIPNLTIVASGNIYIHARVTEIAGLFVAQPKEVADTATGHIYTCAFSYGPPSKSQFSSITGPAGSNCNSLLTINGAFIARRVHLLRTNGSLKDSIKIEDRASTTMAERFIFSPEAWLSSSIGSSGSGETYDYITTLPPVL